MSEDLGILLAFEELLDVSLEIEGVSILPQIVPEIADFEIRPLAYQEGIKVLVEREILELEYERNTVLNCQHDEVTSLQV